MSTIIICAGKSLSPAPGRYNSAGFDAAVREMSASLCPPYEGKRLNPEGKNVLIGEGRPALDTAEKNPSPLRMVGGQYAQRDCFSFLHRHRA